MDLEFDFKGDPVGGVISTYLLEKSRVVQQLPGEQNFHVFYQLITGTDADFLEILHLKKDLTEYRYLSSDESLIRKHSYVEDFEATLNAMEVIGFTAEEISSVFELLSAILNLGNVSFEGYSLANETQACRLKDTHAASYACDMLGCSMELMNQCLTQHIVETSKEVILTPFSESDSVYARDGLCKAIYERLFIWLVNRINDKIKPKSKGKRKAIGVLDIYGFEVFESNSFEQFMINYCNEKLQQLFVDLTIGSEQKEYILEGIEWETVEFFDNSIICELIEDPRKGIIALLDEECLRPGKVTDETFLEKLNKKCAKNSSYISRAMQEYKSDSTLELNQFRLKHYAGLVTYDVTGFIDKNRDLLFKDLSQAMFACERPLLKIMFPEGDPETAHLKRPSTTGHKFKSSVNDMMKSLLSKNPNYVRCIKPNDLKKPKLFEDKLVENQIQYMNLLENIRVRRAGYAFRQSYEQFLQRYKMLSDKTWPNWKKNPRDGVKTILQACKRKKEEVSFGRTKIFVRNPKTVFDLESERKKKMHILSTLISKNYRMWIERKKFRKIVNSQITIARYYRGSKVRKEYLIKRNAAIVIQKYFHGWQVRDTLAQARKIVAQTYASYTIRRYFYAWKLRKTINYRIYSKKSLDAVIVIQKYYRGWKVRKQVWGTRTADASLIVANFIRRALCYHFLVTLLYNLPSRSPLDKKWPKCSPMFRSASIQIRNMYHRWRCKQVRNYYNDNIKEKRRLLEKSRASMIFKGKKSLYPSSIPVAFISDRLRIRADERWIKLIGNQKSEMRIVWAAPMQKMNRNDGKLSKRAMVITSTSIYTLDIKNYQLEHVFNLNTVERISVSPHNDGFFTIHIKKLEDAAASHKYQPRGDVVFTTKHVIEGITKLCGIIQETQRKQLPVTFSSEFKVELKQDEVSKICFQRVEGGASISGVTCTKKGNSFIVTLD
jgi:myosin-1